MSDTNGATSADAAPAQQGWMSDVQRAIAIMLVGTLCICIVMATARVLYSGDAPTAADMAKTLQAALVNMGLIALGFFFGNTMAKMAQDAGQQKVVDKLTSTQPPNGGPVAPVPAPSAAVPWWSKLTDTEKSAITSAASTDPHVQAIVAAMTAGASNADDLAYLVTKLLLTPDRATLILNS